MYYPNYYGGGYSYGSQYPLPNQQAQQFSYPMPQQMNSLNGLNNQQNTQPVPQGLYGKLVDGEDVVRATEVPVGGYGIFPKADLSEIYIKSWNNHGTTDVIAFRPVIPEPSAVQKDGGELTSLLLQKIEVLENKIDMFLAQPIEQQQQQQPPQSQPIKKVEVPIKNGF